MILVVTANCPLGTPAGAQEPPPSNERWGVPGGWLGLLEKWVASKYYQWFNGVLCDCNVIFNVILIGFNLV